MTEFEDKPIYHITHVDNVFDILSSGRLLSNDRLVDNKVKYINLAHHNIQDRRKETLVPCGMKGNLHDYIPFYFAPRSPMLYAIHKGMLDGYSGSQNEVVYWVTRINKVVEHKLPFVFTDGHGTMAMTSFYDHTHDLEKVDWDVMKSRYWNDTEDDPDRKRRRQAEFLIHQACPISSLLGIVVKTDKTLEKVKALIESAKLELEVIEKPNWYFEG